MSLEGKAFCRLGSGEVVGEMAYLHPNDSTRTASVVTLEPTLFLEINSAALDLSSDELIERFNKTLIAKVLARLREGNKALSKLGHCWLGQVLSCGWRVNLTVVCRTMTRVYG